MNEFLELSLVIMLAALFGFAARALKQPLVISYILTGIVAGPAVLDILHSKELVEVLSKMGITILLYIVGLGLNPRALREVGKVAVVTGVGQVLITVVLGFLLASAMGIPPLPAFYVALALAFSSTIIILKLLSDKGDTHKLYGKISIGFLLVQDLIATLALLLLSTFGTSSGLPMELTLALTFGKGVLLLAGVLLVSHYLLKRITQVAARSQELLYLFSIAWGLGVAGLFAFAGFSVEIGALAAGVALAPTPFAAEIGARLRPLRDFLILLFFVLLGAEMDMASTVSVIPQAVVLSLFVLIGNPLVMIFLMKRLGYRKQTSFKTGLAIAQISEFSLILVALGLVLGQLTQPIVSLVTLVGLITIAGSTYMILYADKLYTRFEKYLRFMEAPTKAPTGEEHFTAVLFGYNRVGRDLIKRLRAQDLKPLVVDYDPAAIKRLERHNVLHRFGDATDIAFLEELDLSSAQMLVSTLTEYESNLLLLRTATRHNPDCLSIVFAESARDALRLYRNGATHVVMPHYLGAQYTTALIEQNGLKAGPYLKQQRRHIAELEKRVEPEVAEAIRALPLKRKRPGVRLVHRASKT